MKSNMLKNVNVKHFFKETIWFEFKGKLKDIKNLESDVKFIISNE